MLSIQNLSSSYDKKNNIIKEISLTLDNGLIGIVLGKNGAGKSTLFKTILNLMKFKNGEIILNDISINTLSSKERAKKIQEEKLENIKRELNSKSLKEDDI